MSPRPPATDTFSAARLERVFARCFAATHRTRLAGGAAEPLYLPAEGAAGEHLLFYRADYFASALHETAHWCIAGAARRRQVDFGYWYVPDGRDGGAQRAFEAVEYKPQALEWLFSRACGWRFRPSLDNLAGGDADSRVFGLRILRQARVWQRRGLPARAGCFYAALCEEFGTHLPVRGQPVSSGELA